jgi:hypothetical protein
MYLVDTLNLLLHFHRSFQMIDDPYSPDYQNVVLSLDLAHHLTDQVPAAGIYLARLQRAPEGADQSTRRRRNHVIDCRRMRLYYSRADTIMLGDGTMDSEPDRLPFGRKVSKAQGAYLPLYSNYRCVNYL